jgi:hypothetical protein
MKKNYTFSNLPIAAIVLLVASLPCLAQVTANESTSALAVADNGSTLAMNNVFRAVPPTVSSVASIEDAAVTSKSVERVKSPKLTPAMFRVSEESSLNSKVFTRTQLSSEVSSPDSKEQFRVDADTPTASSKVTFVPSRGFRLPTYDFKLPNN